MDAEELNGREVLDESLFSEAVDLLIQRKFFPNLLKLKAVIAVMEAQESGDSRKLQEAKCLQAQAMTNVVGDERKSVDLTGLSVDSFFTKYTSADNVSFNALYKKHQEVHRKKHAWMFEQQEKYRERLLKLGGPEALAEYDRIEGEKKQQAQESTKAMTDMMLMLPPAPRPPAKLDTRPPKEINHSGTAFELARNTELLRSHGDMAAFATKQLEEGVWSIMKGDQDILAMRRLQREGPAIDLDDLFKTPQPPAGANASGNPEDSPRVAGYGFVSTPQLSPGQEGLSPFMTWGAVDATPMVLAVDPEQSTGPRFNIPNTPKRDLTALKLAEKASRRMRREKASLRQPGTPQSIAQAAALTRLLGSASASRIMSTGRTGSVGTPLGTTPHSHRASTPGLSPAALSLAQRLGRGMQGGIFNRATTPASTPQSRAPEASPAHQPEAKRPRHNEHTAAQKSSSSITDGLLKL